MKLSNNDEETEEDDEKPQIKEVDKSFYTNSIMSPISHLSATQIFSNTSAETYSFFPNLASVPVLIPDNSRKFVLFRFLSISNFQSFA